VAWRVDAAPLGAIRAGHDDEVRKPAVDADEGPGSPIVRLMAHLWVQVGQLAGEGDDDATPLKRHRGRTDPGPRHPIGPRAQHSPQAPRVLSHCHGADHREGQRAGPLLTDADRRPAARRDLVAQTEGRGALAPLLEVRETDPFPASRPLLRGREGHERPAEVDGRLLEDLGADLVAPREALIDKLSSTRGVHGEAAPGIFRSLPPVPPVDEGVPRPRDLDVRPSAALVEPCA
jgi:hypothetical protein